MAWLHALPDLAVFPIVILPLVAAVVAAPYLRRALWPRRKMYPANSEMMDAFIALASSSAILLTLSLVSVEANLRQAEERVAREAAVLRSLDRTLARYGDETVSAARGRLAAFAEAVVAQEWPLLHHGGRDQGADRLLGEIGGLVLGIAPANQRQQDIHTEAIRLLDDLSDLRDERIEGASLTLPPIYWLTTLTMISLMIVLAGLNRPTAERTVITATIATAIGLLAALVIVFDAPFQGSGSISPAPIEHALRQMRGGG